VAGTPDIRRGETSDGVGGGGGSTIIMKGRRTYNTVGEQTLDELVVSRTARDTIGDKRRHRRVEHRLYFRRELIGKALYGGGGCDLEKQEDDEIQNGDNACAMRMVGVERGCRTGTVKDAGWGETASS
jgi:hypothetical protein